MVPQMRLEPATTQSQVKRFTTELLHRQNLSNPKVEGVGFYVSVCPHNQNIVKYRRKGKVSIKRFSLSLKTIYIHEMIIYHRIATDAKVLCLKFCTGYVMNRYDAFTIALA